MACVMNRRRDWIFRLMKEHRYSSGALFVTLTYAPKYCPSSLNKRHVQLFMKRLRKYEKGQRIRYFLVGEYGTVHGRPHYHALLFNCDLSGETIRKAWKLETPIGLVHIGRVTEASIAYCTKYMVQPPRANEKPFVLMSRGYGIGGMYLQDEIVSWHRSGNKNFVLLNGIKNRLPRYYKEKIFYGAQKEEVSKKSFEDGQLVRERNEALFKEQFGVEWESRMKEFRNAFFDSVKTKVAANLKTNYHT